MIKARAGDRKKLKNTEPGFVYYERHHVIPCSFFIASRRTGNKGWLDGNPNSKENIVLLTPEEHYLAHQLLVKIYPDNHGMVKAANLMCRASSTMDGKRNNKQYGWLRRRLSDVFSKEKTGKESPLKGRPSPLKGCVGATKGQASPKKGIKTGPNGLKGIKRGPSPFKGVPSGRKGIASEKKGIPSGKKGTVRGPNKTPPQKLICQHCNKEGGISQMKRWHMDNCKFKEVI